jgi:23S rRNA (pseudouridine1915-N3)-methyltransferase
VRAIRLLYVGSRPDPRWEALADEYRGRLRRQVAWQELRLPLAAGRKQDPAGAREREGRALLAHLGPREKLVALDERGELWSTEGLARFLSAHLATGDLVFALGSDLGLSPEVLAKAHARWSLSPLTLPHEMARVVVMEQLYRALDLLSGGKYHRGGGV